MAIPKEAGVNGGRRAMKNRVTPRKEQAKGKKYERPSLEEGIKREEELRHPCRGRSALRSKERLPDFFSFKAYLGGQLKPQKRACLRGPGQTGWEPLRTASLESRRVRPKRRSLARRREGLYDRESDLKKLSNDDRFYHLGKAEKGGERTVIRSLRESLTLVSEGDGQRYLVSLQEAFCDKAGKTDRGDCRRKIHEGGGCQPPSY